MTATPEQLQQRGRTFRALHERDDPFIVPNPWDVGSARLLARAGFEALATTSAGFAASIGRRDGSIDADTAIEHTATLAAATALPVTADLESGYSDDADGVAAVTTAAGHAGAVGGSIEDLSVRGGGLFEIGEAVERVAAAVDAARALPFDFVVTARCEGYATRRADLAETIHRLQAYQEAGADVLYAPGLTDPEDIHAVVSSVDRPVNVVMGLGGPTLPLAELGAIGVRRVSVGSALARAAYGAFLRAVEELRTDGTFEFAADAVPYATLCDLLADPTDSAVSA